MKDFEIIKNSVIRGDRLWFIDDEREFVQKADESLLETYFKRYKLSDCNEIILLERGTSCIMKYIFQYRLSAEAEIALIKKGNLELIRFYLEEGSFSCKAMIEAVQSGNKSLIKMLILQNYSWPDEVQTALLKLADGELLKLYIASRTFCEKAEALLVEVCSPELVMLYIRERSLRSDAEIALVKRGNKELIEAYLRQYKKFNYWMSEDELLNLKDSKLIALFIENNHFGRTYLSTKMIGLGDAKLVELYFNKYSLSCEDEIALVRLRNFELLRTYMNKLAANNRGMTREAFREVDSWKFQTALQADRFHPKECKQCLSLDLEASFLTSNNKTVMTTYISKHPLSDARELELIKSGEQDLVEQYVWRYYLSDEAEIELVRRGDEKLLEIYMQAYRFSKDAEIEFFNSNFAELIMAYKCAVEETEKAIELLEKFEMLPRLRLY